MLRQAKGNVAGETDTSLAKKFCYEQTERENVLHQLLKQKLKLDEDIADAQEDLVQCEAALKALEDKSTSAADEGGAPAADFFCHLLSGGLEAVQPTSDSQTTKEEWHALVLEAQIKQERYTIEKLESRRRPLQSEIARITAEMKHARSIEDARAAAVLGEEEAKARAEEAQRRAQEEHEKKTREEEAVRQSHEAQALREAEAKAKVFEERAFWERIRREQEEEDRAFWERLRKEEENEKKKFWEQLRVDKREREAAYLKAKADRDAAYAREKVRREALYAKEKAEREAAFAKEEREREAAFAREKREREAARAKEAEKQAARAKEAEKQAARAKEAERAVARAKEAIQRRAAKSGKTAQQPTNKADQGREKPSGNSRFALAFQNLFAGYNTSNPSASHNTSNCDHQGWWDCLPGRHRCSECNKRTWHCAFQCPDCSLLACSSCRSSLKGISCAHEGWWIKLESEGQQCQECGETNLRHLFRCPDCDVLACAPCRDHLRNGEPESEPEECEHPRWWQRGDPGKTCNDCGQTTERASFTCPYCSIVACSRCLYDLRGDD